MFHLFHKYGKLAQISIKQAYGFIQFLEAGSCHAALQAEQGALVRGRKIRKCLDLSTALRSTNTLSSQTSKSRSLNGLRDPVLVQSRRVLLRPVALDRRSLLGRLLPGKKCEPRVIATNDPTSQVDCHSAIIATNPRIADGTTTVLLVHPRPRPGPCGAEMDIGLATGLPKGSIGVTAGVLGRLGRRAPLDHLGPRTQETVVTAARVPGPVALMKGRRTCRCLVERRETCRKCKSSSWKKLTGLLVPCGLCSTISLMAF